MRRGPTVGEFFAAHPEKLAEFRDEMRALVAALRAWTEAEGTRRGRQGR